ncbi:MAG TPA: class I SAM-dependent methyltransferase [Pyrinomonadaceae bacterium]|nr:class I SAM-dependent methyltransferase [Pyrinomonadaceae bacterium]
MRASSSKWSVFDLVEAYQLARAVAVLNDLKVFEAQKPFSAKQLATKHDVDLALLAGVLEFVALRTELLRRTARGQFAVTGNKSRFLIDLYAGAYGSTADQLAQILRDPARAPASVDRVRYARAFASLDSAAQGILPDVIGALGFNYTLDLGCGNGDLLLELARRDSSFVGWGIDSNPAMLKVARARLRDARLSKRVRFIEADCARLRETVPANVRSEIQSLTCCNFANEMFARGERQVVKWFRELRKLFPNRPLLIGDYYGRLGRTIRKLQRETLLHDYAQLISGQGVPPATIAEWRSIYVKAGCRLVHAIEDTSTTRFIHILGL